MRPLYIAFCDLDENGQLEWLHEIKERSENNLEINSKSRQQFKWEPISKDIITTHIAKSIKSTIKEKRIIDGFDTKPFGYITKPLWL